jgi:hypothetical protein
LNDGFRIAATSGRDWHAQEQTDDPLSVTYLQLDESEGSITEQAVRALAAGRASVTMGPLAMLELRSGNMIYAIGDCVPAQERSHSYEAVAEIDFQVRAGQWAFPEARYSITLMSNLGVIGEQQASSDQEQYRFEITAKGLKWVRAELKGNVRGVRTMLAFTNAIYAECE